MSREKYTRELLEKCFKEMELVSTYVQEDDGCKIVRICFCPHEGREK